MDFLTSMDLSEFTNALIKFDKASNHKVVQETKKAQS